MVSPIAERRLIRNGRQDRETGSSQVFVKVTPPAFTKSIIRSLCWLYRPVGSSILAGDSPGQIGERHGEDGGSGSRSGSSSTSGGSAKIVLESAIRLDPTAETITLPVFQGLFGGSPVYYIVTESSDRADAERRKVNWARKLRNALGTRAVQNVAEAGGIVVFSGTVRFASTRALRAGPDGIPPGTTPPPSEGDANYSPLITSGNGIVLNASQVANSTGVHDALVRLDLGAPAPGSPGAVGTVTFALFAGFWNSQPLLYLHMDASALDVATIEGSNFAPNLNFAPGLGSNDPDTSARSAIIPIENGREARGDPERQGLQSFLANRGDPLNVTQTFPGKQDARYSPVWDVHILRWTEAAFPI